MKNRVYVAAMLLVLFGVAPLFAQVPKGWKVRSDHSMNASDPDAAGNIKLVTMGSGFRVTSPQAATFWDPANTASGNYMLKGTFTLIKSTGYDEYYGLIFGGNDLEGAGQSYLYFMVTNDGTWLVKRRTGSSTDEVSEKTSSPAVKKPGADGQCTNTLAVHVMGDKVQFLVNGTVVSTMPKTGALAKTDGIYGIRSNHHLEIQVDGLAMSKM
jgi:hypothetical protein